MQRLRLDSMDEAQSTINSRLHKIIAAALLFYLVFQAFFSFLERWFFWGELLIGITCIPLLTCEYRHKIQKHILIAIYIWIFLLPAYTIWISVNYWSEDLKWYYLFRHLSAFYYAFFFLLAYKYCYSLISLGSKYWYLLVPFIGFFFLNSGISSTILMGIIFLFCANRFSSKKSFLTGLILMFLVIFFRGHGAAGLFSALVFAATPFLMFVAKSLKLPRTSFLLKWTSRILVLSVVFVLFLGAFKFMDFIYDLIALDLKLDSFDTMDVPFGADANTYWRLVFWSYLLEKFWQFPYGIGIGTPIFGDELIHFMNLAIGTNEAYVLGAHNFFIASLVRVGVIFAFYFTFVSQRFFTLITGYLQCLSGSIFSTRESRLAIASLAAFGIALAQAGVNVVLWSPLNAAYFWVTFGFMVRIFGDQQVVLQPDRHAATLADPCSS